MSFNADSKEEIDFEKIIYDCISSYKYLENFGKVEFKVDVQEFAFEGEGALVNSIIQNLIENGIKYARLEDNKPEILVKVSSDGENVTLIAEDNGIGMSEETVDKIFSMFFRVNRTIEGTGLVLHILKRAVEKLGGNVVVESKLDHGTTFTITLPH